MERTIADIFETSGPSETGLVGVFESQEGVAYFYLYDMSVAAGRILGAIHVANLAEIDFASTEVFVDWNRTRDVVGLFIRGTLWAAFNVDGRPYGGAYAQGAEPQIDQRVVGDFQ